MGNRIPRIFETDGIHVDRRYDGIIKGQMATLLNAVAYVVEFPQLIGTLDITSGASRNFLQL
jgi:hypothetical protein